MEFLENDFDYIYGKKEGVSKNDTAVFFFKNKLRFTENYIFQLKISQSFGWIFPISIYKDNQILKDNENNKNKHFFENNFLYPAFQHLLSNPFELNNENNAEKITSIYDEETYILIADKERFETELESDINKIIPALYQMGFCYVEKKNDFEQIFIKKETIENIDKDAFSNITIEITSSKLEQEKYIQELFKSLLKYQLHPIMRFYLLYQVIELLINKIGLEKFDTQKEKIKSFLEDNVAITFYEIDDILKKFPKMELSENKRINLLFEEKCGLTLSNYDKLKEKKLFKTNYENLSDLVYEHRNKIIHGYYDLKISIQNIDEKLEEFNYEFEKLIVDIILKYDKITK